MPNRRHFMAHQLDGFRRFKTKRHLGLFHQMRLGKTLVAVRWANTRLQKKKILVVCPLAVVPVWQRELAIEGHESVALVGTAKQRIDALALGVTVRWHIINHAGLRAIQEYARLPWDIVIVDESTCIRNPRAKITKLFVRAFADVPHRAVLSGLPNPEGPEDFVTQMIFLVGKFMGHRSYWTWRQEHMQPMDWGGWSIKGASLGKIRAAVHNLASFLTRREAGIRDEKLTSERYVKLPTKAAKAMRSVEHEWECDGRMTANALERLTWMTQIAAGTFDGAKHDVKIRELLNLLGGELRGEKVVVWARYNAQLADAARVLSRSSIAHVVVTGETKRQNAESIRRFQTLTEPRILLAQPRCLQMGVDLSRANYQVCLSRYHDHEINAQMTDRTVHPMKREPTVIIDIIAKDTVDEDIVAALRDKHQNSRMLSRNIAERIGRRLKNSVRSAVV